MRNIPQNLELAVVELYFNMYTFFLGLEYQLEIDLNIDSIKQSTEVLLCVHLQEILSAEQDLLS